MGMQPGRGPRGGPGPPLMNDSRLQATLQQLSYMGSGTIGKEVMAKKQKLIQRQLVLLLHAHECARGEIKNPNQPLCSMNDCKTTKELLAHITKCKRNEDCTKPHCSSSRKIIVHWKNCVRLDCSLCSPIKQQQQQQQAHQQHQVHQQQQQSQQQQAQQAQQQRQQQQQEQLHPIPNPPSQPQGLRTQQPHGPLNIPPLFDNPNGPGSMGNLRGTLPVGRGPNQVQTTNVTGAKDWHHSFTPDLRDHLVRILVQAIFDATPDPAAMLDKRMKYLVTYAEKVEGDMYEMANCRSDYYHLLAEKIYKIHEYFLEKRQKRKEQQQMQQQLQQNNGQPDASHRQPPQSQQQQIRPADPSGAGNAGSGSVDIPMGPQSGQGLLGPGLRGKITCSSTNSANTPSTTPTPNTIMSAQPASSMGKGRSAFSTSSDSPPLSSQMAAIEAAARDRDEDSQSPDDDDHFNASGSGTGGGKRSNIDMPSAKSEIETEPMDVDHSSETRIEEEIKDEPMLPTNSDGTIKNETKPVAPEPTQPKALDKEQKCPFKPEELRQALLPTFEKIYRQYPESLEFRQPVDPIALGIPDYFDIVSKPIDLSTIQCKLTWGQYSDPWEYVDDMWLMFDNAWLYNRKTSIVYRYCTRLSQVFEQEIDPVMQALGYCCGRKYTFNPQELCCYGKQLCTIPRDAKYYSYQNKFNFCQKCFNDIIGDTVTVGDDPLQTQTQIEKDQFTELRNDHLELEPFVDCVECGRKQHKICVLYLETIWPGGYVCDNCHKKNGTQRKANKFNAKRLPKTKLGIYIENRVNNFLKKKEAGAGEVHIRVLSNSDKMVQVQPGMRGRFVESGELNSEFKYSAKALFAFEQLDGVDVCFFGMHVQEYGSECANPNTRRVYIAYLDSVHFFKSRQYRTAVYHEILLGYLDYAKKLGYTMAHIWACPPSEGDDYIFHCHPTDQKIPKAIRLQVWYRTMLDKGMIEHTIRNYSNLLKQATEDKLTSAAELPYFEGDFWPNELEKSIKELDKEEEEKRKEAEAAEAAANAIFSMNEVNDASGDDKQKRRKKAKKSNKSKAAQTGNDLTDKMFDLMDKHKDVFLVIRLNTAESAASSPIIDPDPLMTCDLMDGRGAFLTMAREKHLEFSSLRRARFSTLYMLYELHNPSFDKYEYTCNNCKAHVETGYHCTVCKDFDLCAKCKDKAGHSHKMEKLDFDLQQTLRRREAVMNTRAYSVQSMPSGLPAIQSAPIPSGSGGMNPQSVASPVSSLSGMGSPHQFGIGLKPGTQTPPFNVIQVMKQVQEEAPRQQVPDGGGYGKIAPTGVPMPPPAMQRMAGHMGGMPNPQQRPGVSMGPGSSGTLLQMGELGTSYPYNAYQPGLRTNQNQMMQPQTLMPQGMTRMVRVSGAPRPITIMGGAMRPAGGPLQAAITQVQQPNSQTSHALQQLMQTLNNPTSDPDVQQQILQMLKNPQLMSTFIKQPQENQTTVGGGIGNCVPQQSGHLPNMMRQQQQQQQHPQQQHPQQQKHPQQQQVQMATGQLPQGRMQVMQNPMLGQAGLNPQQGSVGGVGGQMQVQNRQQWYARQMMLQQQRQQHLEQQRQMHLQNQLEK